MFFVFVLIVCFFLKPTFLVLSPTRRRSGKRSEDSLRMKKTQQVKRSYGDNWSAEELAILDAYEEQLVARNDEWDAAFLKSLDEAEGRLAAKSAKEKHGATLTFLSVNEHILLHISLFVVLPLPYLCKACAQQGGSSFTSAHIYALSRQGKRPLMWTSCKFSNVFVFILEFVRRFGYALEHASAALQDNREIVLEAVKKNGGALKYASAALKDDHEIVLEAVKQNGCALYDASAARKDDREAGGRAR